MCEWGRGRRLRKKVTYHNLAKETSPVLGPPSSQENSSFHPWEPGVIKGVCW